MSNNPKEITLNQLLYIIKNFSYIEDNQTIKIQDADQFVFNKDFNLTENIFSYLSINITVDKTLNFEQDNLRLLIEVKSKIISVDNRKFIILQNKRYYAENYKEFIEEFIKEYDICLDLDVLRDNECNKKFYTFESVKFMPIEFNKNVELAILRNGYNQDENGYIVIGNNIFYKKGLMLSLNKSKELLKIEQFELITEIMDTVEEFDFILDIEYIKTKKFIQLIIYLENGVLYCNAECSNNDIKNGTSVLNLYHKIKNDILIRNMK